MKILVPISLGELYDKISILEIKHEKIKEPSKLKNIGIELSSLKKASQKHRAERKLASRLKKINLELWEIEEKIRICEKNKDFGKEFVKLARNVYRKNDERYKIKNNINEKHGSLIREEKFYGQKSGC